MTDIWLGNVFWARAQRSGALEVRGPESVRRAVPGWFVLPSYASVPRPLPVGA